MVTQGKQKKKMIDHRKRKKKEKNKGKIKGKVLGHRDRLNECVTPWRKRGGGIPGARVAFVHQTTHPIRPNNLISTHVPKICNSRTIYTDLLGGREGRGAK